jgi:Fe(3+) dicitrate transport protein
MSDKNLIDSEGYNLEAGYRGMVRNLRWDISAFSLRYNNRPGTLAGDAIDNGNFYILRTRIGNSITNGAEIFVEYPLLQNENASITIFTSTAFFDSEYLDAQVRRGNENINISGNRIESVPDMISRNGITFRTGDVSISGLYSYTGESFADPLNTRDPSESGSVGLVPAYTILDLNGSVRIFSKVLLRVNVNNILDKQYFTKRPEFYPGPGVWSSDGRSINFSVGFKL